MQEAVSHVDRDRLPPTYDKLPLQVSQAKDENKEKSYKRFLELQCSALWRTRLNNNVRLGPGRLSTYVELYLDNSRRNLFRPAPYLSNLSNSYQLELLRIRTQGWTDHIPTHLYYGKGGPRQDYSHRW